MSDSTARTPFTPLDPHKVIGVDLSKNCFQVCYWPRDKERQVSERLSFTKFGEFLQNLPKDRIVAFEACSTCHYWGRVCQELGLTPRIIQAQYTRALVGRKKDDKSDSKAIWMAALSPEVKTARVKSESEQSMTMSVRCREHLVEMRTSAANYLRHALQEFGIRCERCGIEHTVRYAETFLSNAEAQDGDKGASIDLAPLKLMLHELKSIIQQLKTLEENIAQQADKNELCVKLMAIPYISHKSAFTMVAFMGDPHDFKNGRQLAAFFGTDPGHVGTGGKTYITGVGGGGISCVKRCLYQSAVSMISHLNRRIKRGDEDERLMSEWIRGLLARKPFKKVACAVANKLARVVWATALSDTGYNKDKNRLVSVLKSDLKLMDRLNARAAAPKAESLD